MRIAELVVSFGNTFQSYVSPISVTQGFVYHGGSRHSPGTCANCSKCCSFFRHSKPHQFPIACCSSFPAFPLHLSQSPSHPFVQFLIHTWRGCQSKIGCPASRVAIYLTHDVFHLP